MLRAILVDDEVLALQSLEKDLQTYCAQTVEVVASCESPLSALQAIRRHQPDVVFLDISLEGFETDGFGLLEILGEVQFSLVFVTAHPNYALQAFKVSAVDYLVKPFSPQELQRAVEKVYQQRRLPNAQELRELIEALKEPGACREPQLRFPMTNGSHFVEERDIMYCRAEGAYTRLFLAGGQSLLVSKGLKSVQKPLSEEWFFRVHYSHLINRRYLQQLLSNGKAEAKVLMKDGEKLVVSRSKKQGFLQWMKQKTVAS
ncbi:MAG: LytTR family DNA-binding domain-containing protein [Bacteroidota bacterium]